MTGYVALLRAVNVGGRKLLMSDLKAIGDQLSFGSPRTFIASGNLLFTSDNSEADLKSAIEIAVAGHMGKTVGVMIRSAEEMAAVAAANPFADAPGNQVVAIFLDDAPPATAADEASNVANERIALGCREIYAHYPDGQGQSKLRIPAAASGTVRNMNTVAKLAHLAKEME